MKHETHTPGPWHIGKRTFAPYVYGPKGEEVAGPSGFTSGHDETLANARLIAAAPDLLAALEQCQTFVSAYIKAGQSRADMAGMPGPYAIDTAIKSAIARATGAEGEGAK